MAYNTTWLIDGEVIFFHYYGLLTCEEFKQSLIDLNTMIDSTTRVFVHVINDVGDVTQSLSLPEIMSVVSEHTSHPRTGWTITTRETSKFVKFVWTIARQLLNYRN